MAYASAKHVGEALIPVIDIAPLRDQSDPHAVGTALHRASREVGFIYIKGHGISRALIDTARAEALAFFRSPEQRKAEVSISASHRGWLGRNGAKMADDLKPDLKESFLWGLPGGSIPAVDDHPLRGPNQWPAYVPDLKAVSMAYFKEVHQVAHDLMRGFALGLGLNEDFFLQTADAPLSRASYVYYPPQPEKLGADQFGVGPHTDFGVLTVLCQDHLGGLQIQDRNGAWVHAPPLADTLVVNVGDLLARWTGGAYRSTPHRVVNSSGAERLSLVLAFDPNPETMIDARNIYGQSCQQAEPPITCGDYLLWRFKKAFAYR